MPGESHGQKSLAGYNPWECEELEATEQLTLSLSPRNELHIVNDINLKKKSFQINIEQRISLVNSPHFLIQKR